MGYVILDRSLLAIPGWLALSDYFLILESLWMLEAFETFIALQRNSKLLACSKVFFRDTHFCLSTTPLFQKAGSMSDRPICFQLPNFKCLSYASQMLNLLDSLSQLNLFGQEYFISCDYFGTLFWNVPQTYLLESIRLPVIMQQCTQFAYMTWMLYRKENNDKIMVNDENLFNNCARICQIIHLSFNVMSLPF